VRKLGEQRRTAAPAVSLTSSAGTGPEAVAPETDAPETVAPVSGGLVRGLLTLVWNSHALRVRRWGSIPC